jgi:hypothetical protein
MKVYATKTAKTGVKDADAVHQSEWQRRAEEIHRAVNHHRIGERQRR